MLHRAALAQDFDGPWRVGLGAGVVAPVEGYRAGLGVSAHGARALSDMFDLRLNVSVSQHSTRGNDATVVSPWLTHATMGVAYKLDVIEWVPYFGVRAGAQIWSDAPRGKNSRVGATLGIMAGVDYAFSRSFGAGVEVGWDVGLREGGARSAFAHAEYRFGL